MPKVVHVSQPVDAGVAKAVADLASAQQAAGWAVAVAAPAEGRLGELLRAEGIRHLAWQAARNPSPSMVRELRDLRRLLAQERPDIVHLHSSKAGLIGRLAVHGTRRTIFQPNGWSFCSVDGLMRRLTTLSERMTLRWTDLVVCVSDDERELAAAHGLDRTAADNPPRWLVVPNGVDTERFRPPTADEALEARRRLGVPADCPAVVCVGRIARQKGQDVLLAGWPAVRRAMPDATLFLIGDGPDRGRLERLGLPGVRFVGTSDDVLSWLWAADVVALPSRWEGLAYTLLEAMACGRSVVAAEATGMRQALLAPLPAVHRASAPALVPTAGPALRPPAGPAPVTASSPDLPPGGAVVPVESPAALAEQIVARLRSPALRDAEGAAGRRRVVAGFSLHGSLDEICGAAAALL